MIETVSSSTRGYWGPPSLRGGLIVGIRMIRPMPHDLQVSSRTLDPDQWDRTLGIRQQSPASQLPLPLSEF